MNRERWVNLIRDRLILMKVATVILWLSWLVSIALSGFTKDIEGKPIGTDHIAFYSAAQLIDHGQGDRIYDYGFLGNYQAAITHSETWYLDAYRNPPFYALLYVPTSRLPYLASFWIWTLIGLALLWFGLGWLRTSNLKGTGTSKPSEPVPSKLELPNAERRFTAFVLAMSFYPVFAVFSFGQNSLLSFGFFCLTFRYLERGKPLLAGLAAGMLLYKPQLLLGLGLWWLLSFSRYWKGLVGLTLMGLFWAAVSFLLVPVETRVFIEKLPEIARYDAFMFWNLHNPRAFGTLIAYDNKQVGNIVGIVCSIAGLACFLLFWRKHRQNLPVMFAAVVFLTLWASPHTMIYEWTLAVIPAVLLWDRVKEKRDDWVLIFAVSWVALFISTPIAKTLFEWTGGWAIQISVPVMGTVAIWTMRSLSAKPQAAE